MRTDFVLINTNKQGDLAYQKKNFRWLSAWFGDETNSPAAGKPNSDALQKKQLRMFYSN
jgi:hypothetical protein